ncbi:ferrochelatase [Bacteriovorax sp. Seq25_V]|uniref:ferrochelatase n=1 Tax=Bacteriovorax sp. Seq25_V TaxID=1201288 RepID=UPI00038A24AA|nr:ferrochelatase [Bacteriovorax sp. Seq25_V]EQC46278.1 ferrochelatase [Bacteriovorax sp. Seq25_V]
MAKGHELVTLPKTTKPVVKVVLVQLGSPKAPTKKDLKVFLKEFLGDPRVVDINPFLWKIILNLFVLPFRPKNSAKLYSRIWEGNEFPLTRITREFAEKVNELTSENVEVTHAFLLSTPRVGEVYAAWEKELQEKEAPATKLVVIPMFPQYSESTIASGIDFLGKLLETKVIIPDLRVVTQFHRLKAFIDNSVKNIEQTLAEKNPDDLVISFHGIPKRRVLQKKDPYYQHCFETFKLIKDRVKGIDRDRIHMTYQSRFGSEEWLDPYTDKYVEDLVKSGRKKVAVYCPSFVADCLETIDEIGNELGDEVKEYGGEVFHVPCVNTDEQWCKDFAEYVECLALDEGKLPTLEHEIKKEDYNEMPELKMTTPPMSDQAKKSLKIVFLTLFLDLVGFSIIFPLFPSLAKHYLLVDGDNYFLKAIFGSITTLTETGGVSNFNSIVLFGGALGAIYSLLQFFAAPLWGALSDRIGRRPVLLVSVFGLFLSYVLWFFSGSFTVLILARFIGGIMGGNISTATAVVADVTTKENRSKGMATIGIAFALGFIIGPALGGISSMLDLTKVYPELVAIGVNPFSMPALIAGLLSLFNLFNLYKKFEESLPKDKRQVHHTERTANIFKLFKPLPYAGVNATNIGHFLFLMCFSGMEFTLTFLAAERLGYSSMDNAYMFIFIGFVIAFVQGGVVRRKAHSVGEKKMALMGLISIIPGLVLIGLAESSFLIYAGLFFLAIGSSMAIPCLTSLVSIYSPAEQQGHSIGIFRSLGALARVIGPIVASLVYWKFNSATPYYFGALFLIIPILMVSRLPKVNHDF